MDYEVKDEGAIVEVEVQRCAALTGGELKWEEGVCKGGIPQRLDSKLFALRPGEGRHKALSAKFTTNIIEALALDQSIQVRAKDKAGNEGFATKEKPSLTRMFVEGALKAASNFVGNIILRGLAALAGAAGAARGGGR